MFFAFFAGLAHDINHSNFFLIKDGTNNGFEVNMNTPLAKLANN
jgi:hypothetical protein